MNRIHSRGIIIKSGLLYLLFIVMINQSTHAGAKNSGTNCAIIPIQIKQGSISVFKKNLPIDRTIRRTKPASESDVLVSCLNSNDKNSSIIRVEQDNYISFWLIDINKRASKKIKADVPRNTIIKWHGNNIFELRYGMHGFTASKLFKVGDIKKSLQVENILLVDAKKNIYVSFSAENSDSLIIGTLFDSSKKSKEIIPIKLSYKYVSDAFSAITSLKLVGSEIHVTSNDINGKKNVTIYSSEKLKNN